MLPNVPHQVTYTNNNNKQQTASFKPSQRTTRHQHRFNTTPTPSLTYLHQHPPHSPSHNTYTPTYSYDRPTVTPHPPTPLSLSKHPQHSYLHQPPPPPHTHSFFLITSFLQHPQHPLFPMTGRNPLATTTKPWEYGKETLPSSKPSEHPQPPTSLWTMPNPPKEGEHPRICILYIYPNP